MSEHISAEHQARSDDARSRFAKRLEDGDPAARLIDLKGRDPFCADYWRALQECESMTESKLITVVNGIRSDDPDFPELAAAIIDEESIIRLTTELR